MRNMTTANDYAGGHQRNQCLIVLVAVLYIDIVQLCSSDINHCVQYRDILLDIVSMFISTANGTQSMGGM